MRLLYLMIFFAFANSVYSQNFFQIKWTYNNVDYLAFMEYNNDEDILVRVAYTAPDDAYKVAEYKCTRDYFYDTDGKKHVYFDGENAKVVFTSKESSYGYNADNFIFTDVNDDDQFQQLYTVDDNQLLDDDPEVTLAEFKALDPDKDFNRGYLKRFFYDSDPTFIKLMKGVNNITASNQNITEVVSKIWFIGVGDTYDDYLGSAIDKDIAGYRKLVRNIAKELNLGFEDLILKGAEFDKDNVVSSISDLDIQSDHVVFFLYRGHGFRWADQSSDFPRMSFSTGFDSESYNIEQLYNDIRNEHSPRLLLAVGDLCNNQQGITPANLGRSSSILTQEYQARYDIKKAEQLFLKKGSMLVVSASPGEVSYANDQFGFFSKSFIDAFKWEISKMNESSFVSWRTIINTSKKEAKDKSIEERKPAQNAISKYRIQ